MANSLAPCRVSFYAGDNDIGPKRIGFDLSKYKSMELWIKGDTDSVHLEVGYFWNNGTIAMQQVKGIMKDQYIRATIDLPSNRGSIGTLLEVTVPAGKTVYIDDIKLLP